MTTLNDRLVADTIAIECPDCDAAKGVACRPDEPLKIWSFHVGRIARRQHIAALEAAGYVRTKSPIDVVGVNDGLSKEIRVPGIDLKVMERDGAVLTVELHEVLYTVDLDAYANELEAR